jgi:hypothetical protein
MKTTIKHAAVFMPCNLFLLTSCHQEELNQEKEDLAEITVECKSLRDFEKQPVLIEQLLPKNNTTTDLEKGNKDGDLYDFKIDSSKVTHVARNGTAFYTMAISRNENEKNTFENLIISDDGDVQRAYLVKYFPDPIYFRKLKNNMHTPYVGGMNFQQIDYNNLTKSMQTERICIRYTQVLCNYDGDEHTAGAKCTPAFIYTRTIQNCFTVIVSSPEPNVMVDLNTGQENGGGGGSSGSAEAPEILTEPIYLFNMRPFFNNLTLQQKQLWNTLDSETLVHFSNFFHNNDSDEGYEYAESLLDYLILNNNSPEEIDNILDLLDDGKIDGQDVVVGPDLPITNMAQYLSIFDTSQPAVLTLSVDQPKSGSHALFNSSDLPARAGHAFITIKQGTKARSFGFYPKYTMGSFIPMGHTSSGIRFIPTLSSFGNDQGHSFDVSISSLITATQLSNTINGIVAIFQSNPLYDLASLNCVDFAIIVFEGNTNINIPSSESIYSIWDGKTPGTLGEVIRSMILPANATKNTTEGTAPLNSSN